MKKYRHIPSGDVFTQSKYSSDIYERDGTTAISKRYITGSDWEEIRVPLLACVDGNIYEGDMLYWVSPTTVGGKPFEIQSVRVDDADIVADSNFDKEFKVCNFATRKGAEEFVLMNKPCLSYNDLIVTFPWFKNRLNLDALKDLIQQKL